MTHIPWPFGSYSHVRGQLRARGVPVSRMRVGRCAACATGWIWDRNEYETHAESTGGIVVRHRRGLAYLSCPECHGQHDMGSETAQLRRTTRLANVGWMAYPGREEEL